MSTICERTDSGNNAWYWIEGESDLAPFFPIPGYPGCYTTQNAVMHRDFNMLLNSRMGKTVK